MKFPSVDFLMGNKWRRSGAKLYSSSTIFTFVPLFPPLRWHISEIWLISNSGNICYCIFERLFDIIALLKKSWCSPPFKIKCHSGWRLVTKVSFYNIRIFWLLLARKFKYLEKHNFDFINEMNFGWNKTIFKNTTQWAKIPILNPISIFFLHSNFPKKIKIATFYFGHLFWYLKNI